LKINLHGGFGEKGRTSVGIEAAGSAFLLDVGINTSGKGADVFPHISPEQLRRQQAIVVSHAHEDHVGALGWCFANGFSGDVYMTAETRTEMNEIIAAYDTQSGGASAKISGIRTFEPGQKVTIGDATVSTGRSGHTAGGVWLSVSDQLHRVTYCADVVPTSAVLSMDPLPPCDGILFDGSYGADPIGVDQRIDQIVEWIATHPDGCLMPTPLAGRSLELLLALAPPVAVHVSMREPLLRQVADERWLRPGVGALLRSRIDAAVDWESDAPFPAMPLLVHDGMGLGGPAVMAIDRAAREGVPILLTGHLPTGSPAQILFKAGRAAWIRLPTHPTLHDNLELLRASAARIAIPHSCTLAEMEALRAFVPGVILTHKTGQSFSITGR